MNSKRFLQKWFKVLDEEIKRFEEKAKNKMVENLTRKFFDHFKSNFITNSKSFLPKWFKLQGNDLQRSLKRLRKMWSLKNLKKVKAKMAVNLTGILPTNKVTSWSQNERKIASIAIQPRKWPRI